MKKRRKQEKVANCFIRKLSQEMRQSQVVVYRHFTRFQDNGEEFSIDHFGSLDLAAISQLLGTFMPIVKIPKEDSYLIGTEVKQMTVRGENCMVRVGGGYVTIEEYYNRYSTKQCVSLYQVMNNKGTTFLDTILQLM